ncbi:hypothetical protein PybrP1_009021 [[Pythium] brassicae (nom. inval.)]|nr:hypothetical protein PybrP1_009021 [[Pythium] brassicae (nom. inval.)]
MATCAPSSVRVSPTNSDTSTASASAGEALPSPRSPSPTPAFSFGSAAQSSAFVASWPSAAPAATTTAAKQSALAAEDAEGVLVFPSRGTSEFRYCLTLTKSGAIRIWLEDKGSKQQWESKDLALDEIVSEANAIPMMKLRDYFESFKSSLLAADTELFRGANKHDLVPLALNEADADKGEPSAADSAAAADRLELQLTVAVHVFSKVLTPTYRFALQRVALTESALVAARLRDQSDAIQDLRAEMKALREKLIAAPPRLRHPLPVVSVPTGVVNPPACLHATTVGATPRDEALVWVTGFGPTMTGWFQPTAQGGVRFLRAGVYTVLVTVHHANTFVPENVGLFGCPPATRPAFYLQKDGATLAWSFGSTESGTVLLTPLVHVVAMLPSDELQVVYCGTGAAMAGSSIAITLLR